MLFVRSIYYCARPASNIKILNEALLEKRTKVVAALTERKKKKSPGTYNDYNIIL